VKSAPDADPSEYLPQSDIELPELRLLQLADSALPIGSLAHSFGLESLVAAELLTVAGLRAFLRTYLEETGKLETVFCREAHRLAADGGKAFSIERWRELNDLFSALKASRESRAASASLGQNFLRLAMALQDSAVLREAAAVAPAIRAGTGRDRDIVHHCAAFGLVCGVLEIGPDRAALAYLHQSIANLVSSCQRLLPLGQTAAAQTLWDLKPAMLETAQSSAICGVDEVASFMPLLDWGAMEHPAISTRLFIS
jgi:urease accessory protein